MSVLDSYEKSPDEVKLYTIDYTKWLDANQSEVLTGVSVTVTPVTVPALVVIPDFDALTNIVTIKVSSGLEGTVYDVEIEISTSLTQNKVDCLLFSVLQACVT